MSQLQTTNKKELATVTEKTFLEIYNPVNLKIQFKNVTTALQAIDQGGKNLYGLRNTVGEKKIMALIKLYLIDLNDLFNLKRPLSDRMIDEIAEEIIGQFGWLNMADIHLIFRRAKLGEYGDMFETLNMPKVLTWFKNYFDERCDVSAQRSRNKAKEYNVDEYQRSSSKEANKQHTALIKKMKYNAAKQNES